MFRLELTTGGGLPTADILEVAAVEKPADLPVFGTADHGTRVRRLRFLNRIPIAVEEIWLDGDSRHHQARADVRSRSTARIRCSWA